METLKEYAKAVTDSFLGYAWLGIKIWGVVLVLSVPSYIYLWLQ